MNKMKKIAIFGMVIALAAVVCVPAGSYHVDQSPNTQEKDLTSLMQPIKKLSPMKGNTVKAEKNYIHPTPVTLGTDIPIMAGDFDDQHPAVTTDGTGNIMILGEYGVDELAAAMIGIWSTNGGIDWAYEDAVGWETGAAELPKLDYYGEGRQAWGTWVPDYTTDGTIHYVEIPDITNPEAGEQGWTAWFVDWSGNGFYEFDSADVACYSNPEKPNDEFFGLVAVTGDYEDNDETMMFSYFTGDGMVTIIFFTEMEEDTQKVSVDIDQSTSMLYLAVEYTNHPQNPDGTFILFHEITPTEDWWQGSWSGWYFFNCTNPRVDASNGNCYVTAEVEVEGDKDIVCWSSQDNGESFEATIVTDSTDMEKYPAVTSNGEDATCIYMKNGNLYSKTTENGGSTWESETQINDVDGTVADEYGTGDIAEVYTAWTDTRDGTEDIYFDSTGAEVPIIQITTVGGGFGITATIDNIGTADATDLTWSVTIEGLVLLGEKTGTIATLPIGGTETIKSGFSLGIGPVTVTVTAGGTTRTASGFMIGPLILGVT